MRLVTPLPTTPGAIIGYHTDGRPIRLIGGGSEDATSDSPPDGQTGMPQDGTPHPEEDKRQAHADEDPAATIARLEREVREARAEAAKTRVNAKTQAAEQARQDLAKQIGKALGLVKEGDAAPDPQRLAEQLAQEQEHARQARVELAVYRAAGRAGADPDALLDSRAFLEGLKDIDPGDEKAVTDAIRKAMEKNPRLRANPAPAASGAPMGNTQANPKPKNLEAAVAARYRK